MEAKTSWKTPEKKPWWNAKQYQTEPGLGQLGHIQHCWFGGGNSII
jgi:hypothetical protein